MLIMTFPILHPLHHLLVNKNVYLVSSVVIDLICFSWLIAFFIVLFFISQLFRDNASQQCGDSGDLYSIYQMMLKGHTYKMFKTAPGTPECRDACLADVRCQSYNVVMFIAICELNNRTKEARPEDFVTNKDRYYMATGPKRGDRKCKDFKAVLQLRRGGGEEG